MPSALRGRQQPEAVRHPAFPTDKLSRQPVRRDQCKHRIGLWVSHTEMIRIDQRRCLIVDIQRIAPLSPPLSVLIGACFRDLRPAKDRSKQSVSILLQIRLFVQNIECADDIFQHKVLSLVGHRLQSLRIPVGVLCRQKIGQPAVVLQCLTFYRAVLFKISIPVDGRLSIQSVSSHTLPLSFIVPRPAAAFRAFLIHIVISDVYVFTQLFVIRITQTVVGS